MEPQDHREAIPLVHRRHTHLGLGLPAADNDNDGLGGRQTLPDSHGKGQGARRRVDSFTETQFLTLPP